MPTLVAEPITNLRDDAWSVELSPDGKRILVARSFSVGVVDAAGGAARSLEPKGAAVWAARFTPDGKRIIGGVGARLLVWDAKTGRRVHTLPTNGIVRRVSVSRDGRKAASSTWEKDVRVWDLTKGAELGGFTMKKSLVNGMALSPDAGVAACGGSDGILRIVDPLTGEARSASPGKGWIDVVERSENGRLIGTAGRAAQVILWDWSGKKLRALSDFTTAITALALAPDGRFVAASGKKKPPLVWSTDTGKVVAKLEGHERVTALSFSHDGESIVTAGPPCVRVWRLD
jgi:WD40 repeat protein